MDLTALNIVEIGQPFVKRVLPQTRCFASTILGGSMDGKKESLRDLWAALANPELDLVVCHTLEMAPFSLRWWLRRLGNRDTYKRGIAFNSAFAPQFLRFFKGKPLAVVDFSDNFNILKPDLFLMRKSTVYFKRELPVDNWHVFAGTKSSRLPSRKFRTRQSNRDLCAKLAPMPLGVQIGSDKNYPAPPIEKTSDIFFAGLHIPSSTVREKGYAELKALAGEGYRIDMPEGRLGLAEFRARCAAARLVWSPEGYGWDCFRHYETPLCWSVPLINSPTIIRHRPLETGVHAVYYDAEPGGLARAAKAALADPARLETMATAAREHVLAHHTLEKQVEYVVRTTLERAGK